MSRLPTFFARLSPVSETLRSAEGELERMSVEVAKSNAQMFVSSAEEGLALWEKDLGLTPEGDLKTRRIRIRTALETGEQLTDQRLGELAVLVGGADAGLTKISYPEWRVKLYAICDGRLPPHGTVLKDVVERLKPAHMKIDVSIRDRWPDNGIVYHGTAEPLSVARESIRTANTDAYILAAGGRVTSTSYGTVDAYDAALSRISAAPLASPIRGHFGGRIGGRAVFGGGYTNVVWPTTVNVYDDTLVCTSAASISIARDSGASALNDAFLLFAGGYSGGAETAKAAVDAYDADLTRQTASPLSTARFYIGQGLAGNAFSLIVGGNDRSGNYSTEVTLYDTALTKRDITPLATGRRSCATAVIGSHILVAGGVAAGETMCSVVETYDADFVRGTAESLTMTRLTNCESVLLGDFCFIAGAGLAQYYNEDLTKAILDGTPINEASGIGRIGDYVLSFGGLDGEKTAQGEVHAFVTD